MVQESRGLGATAAAVNARRFPWSDAPDPPSAILSGGARLLISDSAVVWHTRNRGLCSLLLSGTTTDMPAPGAARSLGVGGGLLTAQRP